MTLPTNLIIFFCSVAPTIQCDIKPNFKSFDYYLTEPCKESFLISPWTKNEILEIISSLDYNNRNKHHCRNDIEISQEQIAENLCFIYSLFLQQVFFQTLKIDKVIPVYKKGSKPDPSLCYQILIK